MEEEDTLPPTKKIRVDIEESLDCCNDTDPENNNEYIDGGDEIFAWDDYKVDLLCSR